MITSEVFWLVVSTHMKNISQNGNLPQIGVKKKHIWNHHLVLYVKLEFIFKQLLSWKHVLEIQNKPYTLFVVSNWYLFYQSGLRSLLSSSWITTRNKIILIILIIIIIIKKCHHHQSRAMIIIHTTSYSYPFHYHAHQRTQAWQPQWTAALPGIGGQHLV